MSQTLNSPGPFGLSSPTTTRPQRRAREPSDAYPFPRDTAKESNRFSKDEPHASTPPPALQRRRTDYKEGANPPAEERDREKKAEDSAPLSGLGSLRRSITTGAGGSLNGPTSPWSAQTPTSGAFSPMGAFGTLGGLGASTAGDKRPGLGGLRSGSRFKDLMNRDEADAPGDGRPSLSELTETSEAETGQSQAATSWQHSRQSRPFSSTTDPYPDDDSSATGGPARGDGSPPRSRFFGLGTPQRSNTVDENGFGAFGMTADGTHRGEHYQQTPHQQNADGTAEPMSPTDTNPYQSPEHERHEDQDGPDVRGLGSRMGTFNLEQSSTLPGLGGFGSMRGVPGNFDVNAADRSQTSSTGPSRGFPSLSGLGGLPGLGPSSPWSTQPNLGTPQHDRSRFNETFGDGAYGSGDLQSPSFGGLGGLGGLGAGGTIGRGSKMSSLFPSGMHDQMRAGDGRGTEYGELGYGANSRGAFGLGSTGSARDTDSPFSPNRGLLDDIIGGRSPFPASETTKSTSVTGDNASLQTPILSNTEQVQLGGGPTPQRQSTSSSASNQPPALQQRQMVMPDRMRWVYKDPQGHQQGPWTGLEMHEWYKAGFFSPELQIKKEEDTEFEPLAHLIRRIGNSREPFLVPQIGIPHGPAPAAQAGNAWASGPLGSGPATAAPTTTGTQPPFANSFPSFGTTLTAEQQNALERRKQEEQYLMARQKEHLAQQQMLLKMQSQGSINSNLQHHGSAHSLHSQPSFGSITSPGGFQASPATGAHAPGQPGFFEGRAQGATQQSGAASAREQDMPGFMERMNNARQAQGPSGTQHPFQGQGQFGDEAHSQNVAAVQNERARLQLEQQQFDNLQQRSGNDERAGQAGADRLQEFHELRMSSQQYADQMAAQHHQQLQQQQELAGKDMADTQSQMREMSLTEQVQRTQSEKQLQQGKPPPAWAGPKIDTGAAVQPFPPPTSQSPMPAPIAQRKQNLADQLNAESRSQSQTPSVDTPSASIAPWAKESATELPKGPSLREIQEAEAKKAAEREAIESAHRRAQAERESLAAASVPAPAPGLPSGATWASGPSGSPSATTPSAWVKPAAGKTPTSATAAKKTLAQIQKEEESRKQRAAAVAAATAAPAAAVLGPGGKRYADLASKVSAPGTINTGGAWTTVGASGKTKAPSASSTPTTAGPARSISGASVPTVTKMVPGNGKIGTPLKDKSLAEAELKKWVIEELRGDIQKGHSREFLSIQQITHRH